MFEHDPRGKFSTRHFTHFSTFTKHVSLSVLVLCLALGAGIQAAQERKSQKTDRPSLVTTERIDYWLVGWVSE